MVTIFKIQNGRHFSTEIVGKYKKFMIMIVFMKIKQNMVPIGCIWNTAMFMNTRYSFRSTHWTIAVLKFKKAAIFNILP